jgi:hypothetical protein
MGSTISTYRALLKERYLNSSLIEKLTYPSNVLLSMLTKKGDEGFVGFQLPVPIITGNPQGLGGVFATAQTNNTNIVADQWAIAAGDYYGVVLIGDKVFKLSRSNQGAYLENKRQEIDGLYEQAGDNLSKYAWGNGGGSLGRRASINGNVVRLSQRSDACNFEKGMLVVASANDGSVSTDSLRGGTATAVTGINRATGDVTLANAAAITSFADGDYLFREGDFFGTVGTIVLKGVQCFLTATDTPMDLWGITSATRQTDMQRYSGCRVNPDEIAGKTYEERIQFLLACMTGSYKSKAPTAGFLHPEDFQVLSTLMSARGVRPLEDKNTQFGFMKIDIMTPAGAIPIYTDRHCPKGEFFALKMDDWWISSVGELLSPQSVDGNSGDLLRRATSTDYEFRLISYPALVNRAPKNSGRVPLAA